LTSEGFWSIIEIYGRVTGFDAFGRLMRSNQNTQTITANTVKPFLAKIRNVISEFVAGLLPGVNQSYGFVPVAA